MQHHNTVLILGARGRFGLAAVRAFAEAGWRVLGQTRPGADVPRHLPVQWLQLELHNTQALAQAAQGATVVVHALNPAYTNKAWQAQVLPMTEAAIALTRALDATLMVPGNIYNFGSEMPLLLREGTPQNAKTIKGQLRIAMEQRLQQSGVRSVVLRAGDFFGGGRGTWFDLAMVKDIRKGVFTYPGVKEVSRAWAYLPDLARAFVAVAEKRASLPVFEVLHFAGHRITGQRWLEVLSPLARAQGWIKSDSMLRFSGLPWPIIRLGSLLSPSWHALLEMRYIWQQPHALANDKLCALIGEEPHTGLAHAAQLALTDLGLLESAPHPRTTPGMEAVKPVP